MTYANVAANAAVQQSKIANLTTDLSNRAPTANPQFVGTMQVPTAIVASNDTTAANTSWAVAKTSGKKQT